MELVRELLVDFDVRIVGLGGQERDLDGSTCGGWGLLRGLGLGRRRGGRGRRCGRGSGARSGWRGGRGLCRGRSAGRRGGGGAGGEEGRAGGQEGGAEEAAPAERTRQRLVGKRSHAVDAPLQVSTVDRLSSQRP